MERMDYTVEELAEMATLCDDEISRELKLRPDVQEVLLAQGRMSLYDLSVEQVEALDDYVFRKEWVQVDIFLNANIIKRLDLTEAIYAGEIPYIHNKNGRFCRRKEFMEAFGDPSRFAGEGNRCVK